MEEERLFIVEKLGNGPKVMLDGRTVLPCGLVNQHQHFAISLRNVFWSQTTQERTVWISTCSTAPFCVLDVQIT